MGEYDYIAPDWDKAGRVHDWRNYVCDEVRLIWNSFSMWQQEKLRDGFQAIADREDWE